MGIPLDKAEAAWNSSFAQMPGSFPGRHLMTSAFEGLHEIVTVQKVLTGAGEYCFRLVEFCPVPTAGQDAGSLSRAAAGSPGPRAVIFLHGFMGGARDWRPVAAGLSLGHRCIAIDLPGHGGSIFNSQTGKRSVSQSGEYFSF